MNIKSKKVGILGFAFVFLLALIPCITDRLYFFAVDDYLINLTAQGAYGTELSQYLIFNNILLGYLIKIFYLAVPAINWYPLFQVISIIFAFSVINSSLFKISSNKVFILLISGLLEMLVVYHLTFTVVSYVCGGAGIVNLICAVWKQKKGKKLYVKRIIPFFLLILLGDFWREGTVATAAVAFLPLIILCIMKKREILGAFILTVFILAGIRLCDDLLYSSNVWEKYETFNTVRSQVLDYDHADYNEYREEFDKIGLSENDVNCLYQWIFADKNVYSESVMEEIVGMQNVTERYNFNLFDILVSMFHQKYNYWFFAVILLSLLLNRRMWGINILIALCTYLLIAALYFRERAVDRVMIPIYLMGIFALIVQVCLQKVDDNININIFRLFYIALPIVLFVSGIWMLRKNNNVLEATNKEKLEEYKVVYNYINQNSEYLYCGSSRIINDLSYSVDIFSVGENIDAFQLAKLGSWDIYSERYYRQVDSYNIENRDSLLLALTENDKVLFISNSENDTKLVKKYLEEHFDNGLITVVRKEFDETDTKIIEFR